jgi:hypothetical protein
MSRVFGSLALVVGVLASPRARAAESAADVETDHVEAGGEGAPRTAAVVLRPFWAALGWVGAEVDVACGEGAVFSVEGEVGRMRGVRGYRAAAGFALYAGRLAFRGFYVPPAFEWARAAVSRASAAGGAVTLGYAWAWPRGFTLRLGGGVAYARALDAGAGMPLAIARLRPVLDADVGWVF